MLRVLRKLFFLPFLICNIFCCRLCVYVRNEFVLYTHKNDDDDKTFTFTRFWTRRHIPYNNIIIIFFSILPTQSGSRGTEDLLQAIFKLHFEHKNAYWQQKSLAWANEKKNRIFNPSGPSKRQATRAGQIKIEIVRASTQSQFLWLEVKKMFFFSNISFFYKMCVSTWSFIADEIDECPHDGSFNIKICICI